MYVQEIIQVFAKVLILTDSATKNFVREGPVTDVVWSPTVPSVYCIFEQLKIGIKVPLKTLESWAIPCQFSGSGQGTLSNFPEISLKLSLPHLMNICKIWMKSVKKRHDYKAF